MSAPIILKKILSRLKTIINRGTNASGFNNQITLPSKRRNIHIFINGNNNVIDIPDSCVLTNTRISISGDNCELRVSEKARFLGPVRITIQDGGKLFIGENCGLRGVRFDICNNSVTIGKLVMFSYGILIRNHDSHKIFEKDGILQLNKPKDIVIGDHVWIAEATTILKGVNIGHDSVIGYGSIVTHDIPQNSVAVGIPAKVTNKTPIRWDY